MAGFDDALAFVLKAEGGYVNDPVDRGGATNMGVTQATYDAYRNAKGLSPLAVSKITNLEVEDIYRTRYWDECQCDSLPWPVSLVVFDAAVNHGPHRAKQFLQQAAAVTADGKIGPQTRAAIAAMPADTLVNNFLWYRLQYYRDISKGDQQKFLRGWLTRTLHLRTAASG
ncbi:MAG: glycoside hydrolase family 108 protein [Nitrospiraceae bacterium]